MKQTIKAMVTIAERGHGNDIAALYAQKKVSCHYHCVGRRWRKLTYSITKSAPTGGRE